MKTDAVVRRSCKIRACVVAGLTLALLPLFSGCVVVAAGAAGAGAVAYVRGEMQSSVEQDLDATFEAAQHALQTLQFVRIDDQKSGVDAQLVSRTALDKRVEIKLKKVTDGLTKIHIRVGVMGDQQLSLTILEKIKAEFR